MKTKKRLLERANAGAFNNSMVLVEVMIDIRDILAESNKVEVIKGIEMDYREPSEVTKEMLNNVEKAFLKNK